MGHCPDADFQVYLPGLKPRALDPKSSTLYNKTTVPPRREEGFHHLTLIVITIYSAEMHKPCVLLLRAGQHNPTRREKKSIASCQEMTTHLRHRSDGQACKWNKETHLRN